MQPRGYGSYRLGDHLAAVGSKGNPARLRSGERQPDMRHAGHSPREPRMQMPGSVVRNLLFGAKAEEGGRDGSYVQCETNKLSGWGHETSVL